MMGIPPATLASKATARPCWRAASNTSAPHVASRALFAVTTSLPAASRRRIACLAQSTPPTTSTATCKCGSRMTCSRSVVSNSRGRLASRGLSRLRTTTRRSTRGRPARAARRLGCSRSKRATPLPTVPQPIRAMLKGSLMPGASVARGPWQGLRTGVSRVSAGSAVGRFRSLGRRDVIQDGLGGLPTDRDQVRDASAVAAQRVAPDDPANLRIETIEITIGGHNQTIAIQEQRGVARLQFGIGPHDFARVAVQSRHPAVEANKEQLIDGPHTSPREGKAQEVSSQVIRCGGENLASSRSLISRSKESLFPTRVSWLQRLFDILFSLINWDMATIPAPQYLMLVKMRKIGISRKTATNMIAEIW